MCVCVCVGGGGSVGKVGVWRGVCVGCKGGGVLTLWVWVPTVGFAAPQFWDLDRF